MDKSDRNSSEQLCTPKRLPGRVDSCALQKILLVLKTTEISIIGTLGSGWDHKFTWACRMAQITNIDQENFLIHSLVKATLPIECFPCLYREAIIC